MSAVYLRRAFEAGGLEKRHKFLLEGISKDWLQAIFHFLLLIRIFSTF